MMPLRRSGLCPLPCVCSAEFCGGGGGEAAVSWDWWEGGCPVSVASEPCRSPSNGLLSREAMLTASLILVGGDSKKYGGCF